MQSIRTLLAGVIDYAGLFPPAGLGMQEAVETFARSRMGDHEWMLGRFVCPASRLEEFSAIAAVMMPGTHGTSGYPEHADISEPWRISVLVDGELAAALEAVRIFNARHAEEDGGRAIADALELKVTGPAQIDDAAEAIPDELYPFFEVPVDGDCRGLVAALAGQMAAAKVRTGGVTPEAFPSVERVAEFIVACAGAEVPFKATAGLHHAVRAEYPLTYETGCPRGVMHGFLNLLVAAAVVFIDRVDARTAAAILSEPDASQFHFTDVGVRWRDWVLDVTQLAKAREAFCLSFGSCSFDEPVKELKGLELL